jgi:hypothetical protein
MKLARVMVVTRNSILISDMALKHAVDTLAMSQPWAHVIQHGRSIALTSARRIIKLLIDAADLGVTPSLATISVSLHALYVLAVNLIRNPTSRMASSDLSVSCSPLIYFCNIAISIIMVSFFTKHVCTFPNFPHLRRVDVLHVRVNGPTAN